jgi:DNA segregation ATPase FtsK/SpoIIIE and related proteins
MGSKKSRRSTKKQKLIFEIYGVLVISFSIMLFISIYYNSSGVVGNAISKTAKGLCGFGAYIIPFFIIMFGIGLIVKQDKLTLKLKFYALCFMYLFFLILIEIGESSKTMDLTFIEKVTTAYAYGAHGLGGGVIGEILAYPAVKLLDTLGAYLFASTFLLINILLFTNASVYRIGLFIKDKALLLHKNIIALFKRDNNKPARPNKVSGTGNDNITEEKEKYISDVNKKIKILDFFKSTELPGESGVSEEPDIKFEPESIEPEVKAAHKEIKEAHKDDKIQDEINSHIKQKPQKYIVPPTDFLNSPPASKGSGDKKELINSAKILEDTLESFGVEAKVVQVSRGPVITRYELQPSPGVKVSKIVNLSDDIALNLAAPAVRIEAPIPGKAAVGIEIPNKDISAVYLREVIESREFMEQESPLTFALGKNVAGNCVVADLSKMPHLLIAGATGSGKSVCVNSLITSILYKSPPDRAKLLLIDPKVVELSTYNGIPHLLIPVVTDPRKAAGALGWAVQEMTNRYKLFADNNVRNIESYNDLMMHDNPDAVLPKVVIIIDELADLMMVAPNDVEDCICRLAQMARAAGMHLVVATQRPSVDVITGVIKANIPSRISFAVSSQIDSRTILDMAGAEKLLGKGDMLYYPIGESKPIRIQGAFITEKEVEQVVDFVKKQSQSDYKEDIIDEIENVNSSPSEADELLPDAIKVVVETGQASISLLQRRLRIGYNRAARLIDGLEERGIIGGYEGSKPRQVLISRDEYEDMM